MLRKLLPSSPAAIGYVCDMLGSSVELMEECLTTRSVHTTRDFVQKTLSESEVCPEIFRTLLDGVLIMFCCPDCRLCLQEMRWGRPSMTDYSLGLWVESTTASRYGE